MKLELTPEELETILNSLAAQPYGIVAGVISKIQQQSAIETSKKITEPEKTQ